MDPEVTPEKFGIGWTINFARASAFPVLILSGVLVGLPFVLLGLHGYTGTWIWWIAIGGSIAVVSLVCWYLASPARFKK
jgi:hypothetical protein